MSKFRKKTSITTFVETDNENDKKISKIDSMTRQKNQISNSIFSVAFIRLFKKLMYISMLRNQFYFSCNDQHHINKLKCKFELNKFIEFFFDVFMIS